jgi:hypothetical protein
VTVIPFGPTGQGRWRKAIDEGASRLCFKVLQLSSGPELVVTATGDNHEIDDIVVCALRQADRALQGDLSDCALGPTPATLIAVVFRSGCLI